MHSQEVVSLIGGEKRQLWAVVSLSVGLGLAIVVLDQWTLIIMCMAITGLAALVAMARTTSLAFAVFGAFLVLLYAGSRDFAYLGITVGGVTVFVSEICLAATCALLLRNVRAHELLRKGGACPLPLAVYLLLGCIALGRGAPEFGLEAIRDAALCYYALAFIVTVLLVRTWRDVKLFLLLCYAGWMLAGIVVLYRYAAGLGIYLSAHEVVRYAAGSQAIASAGCVGSAVAIMGENVNRRVKVLLCLSGIGQLLVGLFLIQHRSLMIATAGTALIVLYFCLPKRWPILVVLLWCVVALGVLPMLFASPMEDLPPIVGQTLERLATILRPEEDANSHWRMVVWQEALKSGASHPILGAGFGRPFVVDLGYRIDYDVDPHNSYVAVFYRLGLPGIIALLFLWVPILRGAFLQCRSDPAKRVWLGMALSGHCSVAIFAFFNVVFEGPYMGIPFWVTLALVQQASRVNRDDDTDQGMKAETGIRCAAFPGWSG